jgi:hypothetical protein
LADRYGLQRKKERAGGSQKKSWRDHGRKADAKKASNRRRRKDDKRAVLSNGTSQA